MNILRPNAARLVLLAAGALVAVALLAPSPAAAQSADTPWFMPQAWMTPKSTAPKVAARPGQYGHTRGSRMAYGGFAQGCYGSCGYVRGTIVTTNGVVLYQPRVVIYDPRIFSVVPNTAFVVTQGFVTTGGGIVATQGGFVIRQSPAAQRQKAMAALPKNFEARLPSLNSGLVLKGKSTPKMTLQNGIRIYAPNPAY